jgi:hypothetical protein
LVASGHLNGDRKFRSEERPHPATKAGCFVSMGNAREIGEYPAPLPSPRRAARMDCTLTPESTGTLGAQF